VKFHIPKDPPLEPAGIEAVKAILKTCKSNLTGLRDKAIILMLIDTGLRASELLALEVVNVNSISGTIQVLHGKGGKFRNVYLGRKSRIALRRYLNQKPNHPALFTSL